MFASENQEGDRSFRHKFRTSISTEVRAPRTLVHDGPCISDLHPISKTCSWFEEPWTKGIYRREISNGKLLFRNENEKSQLRYDETHRFWIVEILRYDLRKNGNSKTDDPENDDLNQNSVLGVFHTPLEKIYNHELNTAFESIEKRMVSKYILWTV